MRVTAISWRSWYITLLPLVRAGVVLLLSSVDILVGQELKLWMIAIILAGTAFNPLANSSLSKNCCNARLVIECALISWVVLLLIGFDAFFCGSAILIAIVLAAESYYRFDLIRDGKNSSLAVSLIFNVVAVCVLVVSPDYQLTELIVIIVFLTTISIRITGVAGLLQRIKYREAAGSVLIGVSGQAAVYLIALVTSMSDEEQVESAYVIALLSIAIATVIQRAFLRILESPKKIRFYISRTPQFFLIALVCVPFLLFLQSEQTGIYLTPLYSFFSVTGYLFYLEGVRGGQTLMLAKCSIIHLLIVLVVTGVCLQQKSILLAPLYLTAPIIRNLLWVRFVRARIPND